MVGSRVSIALRTGLTLIVLVLLLGGCYRVIYPNQPNPSPTPSPTPSPSPSDPGGPSPTPLGSPSSSGPDGGPIDRA